MLMWRELTLTWVTLGATQVTISRPRIIMYYERALSIQLHKLGPDHVDVAYTYHNMGNLHRDLGDHH